MHHPTVRKALVLLAHPVSLAAITLLLVNDLVLRRLWPSWWTGKLGDLAWMVFAPIVLAALIALLLPMRGQAQRHEQIIFWVAFAAVGLGFSAVKTLPGFNNLVVNTFSQWMGFAPALRYDPSDLLALPGLLIGLWVWRTSHTQSAVVKQPSLRNIECDRAAGGQAARPAFTRRHWAALGFATLALMADMAAEDMGISCFWSNGDSIYAASNFYTFSSRDGGIRWEPEAVGPGNGCYSEATAQASIASEAGVVIGQPVQDYDEAQYPWGGEVVPGPRDGLLYRFFTNREIQFSADNGQSWKTVYRVVPEQQAAYYYYRKLNGEGVPIRSWKPQDAVFDPSTGNVLFAMGTDGVLLRTPQEQWVWSALGKYKRVSPFPTLDAWIVLLGPMCVISLVFAMQIFALFIRRNTMSLGQLVCTVAGWATLVVSLIRPPATWYRSDPSLEKIAPGLGFLELLLVFAAVLLAVGWLKWVVYENIHLVITKSPDKLRLLIACLVGGLLYFIPYVLWVYDTLPRIQEAVILSLMLGVIPIMIDRFHWHLHHLPVVTEKTKS